MSLLTTQLPQTKDEKLKALSLSLSLSTKHDVGEFIWCVFYLYTNWM